MPLAATKLLLVFLYGAVAGLAAAAARAVGRPLDWRALLLSFALPLVFLAPALTGDRTILPVDHAIAYPPWKTPERPPPRNPNLNDVVTQFAPWSKAVRMAWEEGSLPLRNRWSAGEASLVANGSAGAFSPLTFLMFALPLADAFTFAAAVKLFLALSGTWLWLRALGISPATAQFGSAAFGLSATMTLWLLFPQTAVVALWPWALFAIERLREEAVRRRAFALLTALFVLFPLAGHLESAALGAFFVAVWLLARWAQGSLPDAPQLFGRIALAAGIAIGLTAFALLPQALAIRGSNREVLAARPFWAAFLSAVPHGPAWLYGLLLPLFPKILGDGITTPMRPGTGASFPEVALGSISLVAWLAALLILRPGSRRRREALALLAPLVVGLGVAIGQWPFAEIAALVPGLRWVFPLRFFSLAALAGAALAAFELDRLGADWRPAGRPLVVLGLAAATAVELLLLARPFYLFGPSKDLFPDRPILRFLQLQSGPFRVLGNGDVLFPNTNVFAGLEEVRTHDPLERRAYVEYLDRACGYPPADYFKLVRDVNSSVFDRLNVRFLLARPGAGTPGPKWTSVYAGADGTVFENAAVRACVTGEGAEVSDYRERTNSASFRVRIAPGPGDTMLLASLVQDGGWSADVDGGPASTGRTADGPFLTLKLPPGDHDVRLLYRPPGWLLGVMIASTTTGLMAALAALRSLRSGGP